MAGSGYEDLLIEAGVCANGSIDKVISGKHYNRAMHVRHRMLDALERILLDEFMIGNSVNTSDWNEVSTLAAFPSNDNLRDVVNSNKFTTFVNNFNSYKDEIRQCKQGKTAQFWISYCDSVWILLMFHRAIKENNQELYIDSLLKMCSLLFSSYRLHYARYLPLYYTQLKVLPTFHRDAELV